MTLTRQAACIALVGFIVLLTGKAARAQQDAPLPTQPPAPIVRVPPTPRPRPQTAVPQGTQPRATTSPTSSTPLSPRTVPGATSAARRPSATTQTTPGSTTPRSTSPLAATPAARPATPRPATSSQTSASGAASPSAAAATTRPAVQTATAPRKPAAPTLSATGVNRNVIVLDPGHGGVDGGARIGESTLEKDVTLALAFRLRSLLLARGFTVVLTRDSDAATEPTSPATPLSFDDRAGIANHMRAAACLLLHATGRGTGVHLYTSELDPAPAEVYLLPWLTAQAAWIPASQHLGQQLGAALGRSHIPLVSSAASVRPVDSLTCPAVVLELAPENETPASINDAGYQERVAAALAGALVVWETAVQPPVKLPPPPRPVVNHTPPPEAAAPEAQP